VSSRKLAAELLELWHHLMRGSSQQMYALIAELDVSITQMKTLHVLVDRGSEVSVKELSDRLGLSLPGASRMVDGLLRRGWLERREDWEPWPELARSIESFEALASVPLVAGGRALGALALSFQRARVLDQGERSFMLALADLAAHALDRARLYEERAYVARTLQAGLLPEVIVAPPGLEVAVRYHSIADGGEVGGDFYDVFEARERSWAVVVGDVCGKGPKAAGITGLSSPRSFRAAPKFERAWSGGTARSSTQNHSIACQGRSSDAT